jgi:hypothetical protein
MNPKVLHVFKASYKKPQHKYLGSVKDIRSRHEYFESRGIECHECLMPAKDTYQESLEQLAEETWNQYTAIVFEMTFSPLGLQVARRKAPHAKILVRSHNAEFLHRFDWARAEGFPFGGSQHMVNAFKNCWKDYLSGRHADYVLSITPWEADHYWRRLTPGFKVKSVPFFLPDVYSNLLKGECPKKNICIHFGASQTNPLIIDATRRFIRSVEGLGSKALAWEFISTGDNPGLDLNPSGRIRWMGLLEDPYLPLREAKAMAHLSDLGYGFKTKLLEAIVAKVFVILPMALFKRMPEALQPYCVPINMQLKHSFEAALEKCNCKFPDGNPNQILRSEAFHALDEILSV